MTHPRARPAPPAPRARWGRVRLDILGALLPTMVAAALVLHDLGSRSLWIDEGDTFATASQHGQQLLHAALNDGGNMFIYYVGMHYWMALFGSSEFSIRMPTALAAIATVPVSFYLLKRLFDLRAAVFGALFVAVSVPFVWWAQTARAYVPALFLVCAATLAFVVAVQTKRRLAWASYGALTALSAYAIVLAPLVVVAQIGSLMFRRWRDLQWKALLGSAGAAALLAAPLAWVIADHGTEAVKWVRPTAPLLSSTHWYLVQLLASSRTAGVPFSQSRVQDLTLATLLCWGFGAWLFVSSVFKRRRTGNSFGFGLLFGWLLLPPLITYVLSVEVEPMFVDRYLLVALLPASMIIGVSLSRLRPWPVAVVAGLAVLLLRADMISPSYAVPLENWRQGVTNIASRSRPHDCIAFFIADGYTPFDYYARHLKLPVGRLPVPVLPASSWQQVKPYVLDPATISPARMPGVVSSCPRIWLLSSHDSGFPPGPNIRPYLVQVYDAHRALVSELDRSYRPTSTWGFPGVAVALYVRRGP